MKSLDEPDVIAALPGFQYFPPQLAASKSDSTLTTPNTAISATIDMKKGASQAAGVPQFSLRDYTSFFFAGALCCTITHGAMTPIDVVKTRIQVDPAYARHSMFSGARLVIANDGAKALLTGFGPTAVGYFVQGGTKFAGYEVCKKKAVELVGSQEAATKYRTAIYLGSASIAEFFADILLTPLEATRIRLVSQRGQIPYAIGQFTVNELCHELAFRSMSLETRHNLTPAKKFTIQLGSGIIAGFAAAILSHPADTLLSQINKGHGPTGSMLHRLHVLSRETGGRGLFAGLGPRMIMTAGLVSGQFLLYGAIKEGGHLLGSAQ
ncbi:hypothetical protein ID866_1085 [Astraeus odoratus]|nr:hypothetical protein ID866_1085 [Astraeus odoratus]